jgi:hypothetical protein
VRFNFFAVAGPDNRLFANARRFFTSSFDHATNTRRFAFAINASFSKGAHHIATRTQERSFVFCSPQPRSR